MTDEEAERLIGYLIVKHRWLESHSPKGLDLEAIVATTVADTMLVMNGSLTVDDFKPGDNS